MIRRALLLALLVGCGSESEQGVEPKDVIFDGVHAVSEGELRDLIEQDLKRFSEEPRLTVLQDAAWRIEYRYRLSGFHLVLVTPRVVANGIVFQVEEGPRIRLGRVRFQGATLFQFDELRQLVPARFLGDAPPFSLRLVTLIEEGLFAAYRDRGYLDLAVVREISPEPDKNNHIHVTFHLTEGKPYYVNEIRGLPSDEGLAAKTAEYLGKPFTPTTGDAVEASIVDYYREHGRPFAAARVRPRVDPASGSVALEIESRQGSNVRLGDLRLQGNVWTRPSFLLSRAALEEGAEFKSSDLHRAEERLIATNAFKRVRVFPVADQEENGRVPVEIEIEEKESGEASIRGGYGSFEKIRLGADLTGINIWGGAETLRVGGNVSQVGYRGESELGVPYLFGTELRLGVSGYYEDREYPSYEARSRGAVIALSYPILEPLNVTVGLRRATISTSNVDPSVPPGDLLDFNYTAIFFAPALDLRDNALLPTRGILLAPELSVTPFNAFTDVHFFRAGGRFSFFLPFPLDLVFATSFQGAVVVPFGGTDTMPISLREFAGGTNTVRGFKFEAIGPQANGDPTGGEVFLAWQSEIRFPIWGALQGAFFSDQGGVWFEHERVNLSDIRYSVGTGIRFATPAGALVADVGWNPNPRNDEHSFEFHLSVGFPF